ncbi:MAG: HesA/MoeB/ThiF family protein [Anaerolineae bacterium]
MEESETIKEVLRELAGVKLGQDQVPPGINLAQVRAIAARYGLAPLDVELHCLVSGILPERYRRNYGTIGLSGQVALLKACVAVVGAGGLGGFIIEGLARMGVGRITIIDGDLFTENNLNRQLGCTEDTLGMPKAKVLAERALRINSAVSAQPVVAVLDAASAPQLLRGAQVVIDALDNLPSRLVLQRAAQEMGVPFVHGAIAGNTGQVMTIYPDDQGLTALYGEQPAVQFGVERSTGNPAATPMLVAAWQIAQTVQLVTGKEVPAHRLLLFDLEFAEMTEVTV